MAPITLTKQQFLQKRPKGVYANYLSFINAHRAAPAAAARVDPLSSLLAQYQASIPKPGQLARSSAQAVADSITAQNAGIDSAYRAQQAALLKQQERAQGFATALGNLTKNDPAAIASQYREGADRLAAYGTGLTGAVADEQTQQLAKARESVAGILGPNAAVTGYDPNAVRNVAVLGNVTHPASTLEAQALDAYNRAGYNRASQVAGVGAIASGYGQKIDDIIAEIAAKKADLEGQRPALVRQELASEEGQSRQNMATLLSGLGLLNTTGRTNVLNAATKAATKAKAATTKATTTGQAGKGTAANYWLNPVTGVREKVGEGNTIVKLNGVLTKVKVGTTVKTRKDGKQVLVPPPSSSGSGKGKKPSPTHLQQKTTKGGDIYLFDPVTGNSYLPGDTKNPIDPNTLKGKAAITPDKLRQLRFQAQTGVAGFLGNKPKAMPAEIYAFGVGEKKIPGWIMVQALRAEALKHPDDEAWQNVLKPGWVSGRKKTKRRGS